MKPTEQKPVCDSCQGAHATEITRTKIKLCSRCANAFRTFHTEHGDPGLVGSLKPIPQGAK